ncbi:MAG: GTPase ObgE [Patescibacteria group bacterium]|nr:GTPase ObgE [Patescibacteria group bacterium]
MLIDEAFITVRAGNGGPGKVSFFPMRGGPDGGDGGRGGDLFVRANRQYTSLEAYTRKTKYVAEHGAPGASNRRKGRDGEPLYLSMPVGTLLRDIESGEEFELLRDGQEIKLCEGGKGGKGNDFFKSSTNQAPCQAQPGLRGQERRLKLIMRYIADIGLIGLPNAGKSSLLNKLTSARAKTANYPFTTLEPNLGVIAETGNVVADIPGLIEGASTGKGLGSRFLKHVEKVKVLVHCISAESTDPVTDYNTIRAEMENYNGELTRKPEVILVTKTDLTDAATLKKICTKMKKKNPAVHTVSIYDYDAIQALKTVLGRF